MTTPQHGAQRRAAELIASFPFLAPSQRRRRARKLARTEAQLKKDLVDARKQRDLTQQDVGDLLAVTQATISRFEDPDNDPRLSTIIKYANAIGATVTVRVDLDNHDITTLKPASGTRQQVELPPQTSYFGETTKHSSIIHGTNRAWLNSEKVELHA